MPSSDADLVRRVRNGDEEAYHELVDRYAADLYGLAYSLVGNAADAEDVLQETFSGAFRHAERFEGRASIRTWLIRIMVRQAARCHRTRGRKRAVPLDEQQAGAASGSGAEALDARIDVYAALDALEPAHREVLVLRELEGLSYDDIAGLLDVPRGTVESRLFRARRKLREQLGAYFAPSDIEDEPNAQEA